MKNETEQTKQTGERNTKRKLGLYIHIPFCVKKCDYCDFLSAPANESAKKQYMDALRTEIESYRSKVDHYIVPTIFIGGGTPSSIDATYIGSILNTIRAVFELEEYPEVSIEVNPGTVTKEKLQAYYTSGVNRISFGLQSANNEELKLLGRIHTYEEFRANFDLTRQIGFRNINIDLMSALPKQTLASWEMTLKKVISLGPEHISAYSLIIEEETPFYDLYNENGPRHHELPDEDNDRKIYYRTKELLEKHGYHRYEISNYAKEGYECRHNCSYWNGTEYLGLGLGASSLLKGVRFTNIDDISQYIKKCEDYQQENNSNNMVFQQEISRTDVIGIRTKEVMLSIQDRMEEFMFLGLRMSKGIRKSSFFDEFQVPIEDIYGEKIQKLTNNHLMISDDDRLYLSEYGVDISNQVLSEFLLED